MANRNVLVGIFVVCGLILFRVGILFVRNRHEAFARHVEFFTEFTNLDGLTNGSKVRVAGMDAAEVVDVGVPNSPSSRFRIWFRSLNNSADWFGRAVLERTERAYEEVRSGAAPGENAAAGVRPLCAANAKSHC
jgi:hypothetical protein